MMRETGMGLLLAVALVGISTRKCHGIEPLALEKRECDTSRQCLTEASGANFRGGRAGITGYRLSRTRVPVTLQILVLVESLFGTCQCVMGRRDKGVWTSQPQITI